MKFAFGVEKKMLILNLILIKISCKKFLIDNDNNNK